jgi:hypothetical protein
MFIETRWAEGSSASSSINRESFESGPELQSAEPLVATRVIPVEALLVPPSRSEQ